MSIHHRFGLQEKVAIITGASKGIGKAIAFALGEAGAKVVVSSRKQEAVDAVAQEFRQQEIDAIGIAAHVGKQADNQALIAKTIEHFGGVDILINNAATNPVFGAVLETDEAVFDKIMNVNLKAPFELAKLVYPSMKERGGGSIINISSIGGISPETDLGIYSVSKAGLLSLTKTLAKEWGDVPIRVNAICPGLIKTKFSKPIWENDKITAQVIGNQPLKRIGESQEVADMALFLASEAATYVTGGVFTVDGGHSI